MTGRLVGHEFGSAVEANLRLNDMTRNGSISPIMAQARLQRSRACGPARALHAGSTPDEAEPFHLIYAVA
ncbi:hypothetical protein ACFWNN_05500 [Lentzea sp. NPDC058450]|uniref:hypothetical protein n=1 Tax=Lentzea sp. NPDC058450 TaxID=3346505 RepID=UPI003660CAE8